MNITEKLNVGRKSELAVMFKAAAAKTQHKHGVLGTTDPLAQRQAKGNGYRIIGRMACHVPVAVGVTPAPPRI